MTTTTVFASVKGYLLDNMDDLRQVVSELNSWNGCLDQFDVWENDDDFFNTFFEGKPQEAVRAAIYGDYNYTEEYVRFNGYGNLESLSEYDLEAELKDSIDEIVDALLEEAHNLNLSPELEALLEEEE